MVKKLAIVIFILIYFTLSVSFVLAKRILPQAKTSSGARSGGSSSVSVKFRSDRLAIIVGFSNLSQSSSIDYALSYNTRGTTQGAGGKIDTANSSEGVVRELLFGTCSHGVCRYDTGITNAKFVVTRLSKNGLKYTKTYRLKV